MIELVCEEGILFDLDQTLVDSSIAERFRRQRSWQLAKACIPRFELFDGICTLWSRVERSDMRIAVVTSSPRPYAEAVLRYFDLEPDALVCYHDTARHKPWPDPLREALERLDVGRAQAWAVGDAPDDIEAANELGIISIAAVWGATDPRAVLGAGPDLDFDNPDDLADYLLGDSDVGSGRGSVYDLAEEFLGVVADGGPPRFHNEDWFAVGETVARCPACRSRLSGFRAPYETSQGTYHYWGLVCQQCRKAMEPADLSDDDRKALYASSKHRPSDST